MVDWNWQTKEEHELRAVHNPEKPAAFKEGTLEYELLKIDADLDLPVPLEKEFLPPATDKASKYFKPPTPSTMDSKLGFIENEEYSQNY